MKNPKIYYYLIENYKHFFSFLFKSRVRLVRTRIKGWTSSDVNIKQEIDFQVINNYFDDDFELLEIVL